VLAFAVLGGAVDISTVATTLAVAGPCGTPGCRTRNTSDENADSDEVAWAIRDDVARDYEMMSPGFSASLAGSIFAVAGDRSAEGAVPDTTVPATDKIFVILS
jgi:hypothetical protein